jgi:hypothetical protein
MKATETRVVQQQHQPETQESLGGSLGMMEGGASMQLKQMQQIANNSAQVGQLKQLQSAANNSPQVRATAQLQAAASAKTAPARNNGLPAQLKQGIESLSGISMDDVNVHYNSSEPAQLKAHAFAQGTDIHVAPGQEQHLAHEAWHVVQQKQGRVKANTQLKGIGINDDSSLEREADQMGAKALQMKADDAPKQLKQVNLAGGVSQLKTTVKYGGLKNGVGTSMEAFIDHTDVSYGSSPQEEPYWWDNMKGLSSGIKSFTSRYLVQGHLLNDNLSGPGEMKNMTPITKSANTQMLNFYEKVLKTEVLSNGKDITYRVFPQYHYKKAPTAEEIAGGNLGSSDKSTLDSSGYLNYFCDWIYADYKVHDGFGNTSESKGLWVKNESNELKGDF